MAHFFIKKFFYYLRNNSDHFRQFFEKSQYILVKGVKIMVKIFAAVLVTAVIMIVVFQFIDPNVTTPMAGSAATTLVSSSTNSISVSISGEVTRVGTYILEPNTILGDLISLAGGVTSNADDAAYDTSYLLQDAMSFYIAPKYNNQDACSMDPIVKVNINADDAETLQTVSGIGSSAATSIVSYRTANGSFGRIEDIKNVSGIKNATFEKIKNYIRLR